MSNSPTNWVVFQYMLKAAKQADKVITLVPKGMFISCYVHPRKVVLQDLSKKEREVFFRAGFMALVTE